MLKWEGLCMRYLSDSALNCVQVNDINMVNATHAEAVAALKSVTTHCQLVVSREVLVVLPDEMTKEEGEEQPPTLPAAVEEEKEEEEEEENESENVAKKIVEDILDRSMKRYAREGD